MTERRKKSISDEIGNANVGYYDPKTRKKQLAEKERRILARLCTYAGSAATTGPGHCDRKARRNMTVCTRHYSGGRRLRKGELAALRAIKQSCRKGDTAPTPYWSLASPQTTSLLLRPVLIGQRAKGRHRPMTERRTGPWGTDPNRATIYVMQGGKSIQVRAYEGDDCWVTLSYGEDLEAARREFPNAKVKPYRGVLCKLCGLRWDANRFNACPSCE